MRHRLFNDNIILRTASRIKDAVRKRILCLSSVVGKRDNASRSESVCFGGQKDNEIRSQLKSKSNFTHVTKHKKPDYSFEIAFCMALPFGYLVCAYFHEHGHCHL